MDPNPTEIDATAAASAIHRKFIRRFAASLGIVISCFALALAGLDQVGRLPPPPLTANVCIDEKFRFLSQQDLKDVDLIAVGSSVTWRNLDLAVVKKAGLSKHPLNAAPCYLHAGETTYFTEFLLSRMDKVRQVITVVAPRDFEQCKQPNEAFFSRPLAEAYIFDGMPSFPIYLSNLKPVLFARDLLHIREMREDPQHRYSIVMDGYGSGPLHNSAEWLPEPLLVPTCFQALAELEKIVNRHGARLIVAAFPMQPAWCDLHDPDGSLLGAFEQHLKSALTSPTTVFISGRQRALQGLHYADGVHFLWSSAQAYTHLVTDALTSKQTAVIPTSLK